MNPSGEASDPVNTATGAFVLRASDARLPGPGVSFELRRVYSSAQTSSGDFGAGWTHSYAASLTVAGNGDVTLHSEDGQELLYVRQPDGTFTPAAYARSRLAEIAGGYRLTRADQVQYEFSSAGKLLSIEDRNGRGVSLSYDGNGLLATIMDDAGRSVAVTRDGGGRIAALSLPGNRSISYAYTNGRLTSLTDAEAGVTSYRYDPSGRLDRVTDANGHVDVETV